jgi:hypothetical protein
MAIATSPSLIALMPPTDDVAWVGCAVVLAAALVGPESRPRVLVLVFGVAMPPLISNGATSRNSGQNQEAANLFCPCPPAPRLFGLADRLGRGGPVEF